MADVSVQVVGDQGVGGHVRQLVLDDKVPQGTAVAFKPRNMYIKTLKKSRLFYFSNVHQFCHYKITTVYHLHAS